MSDCGYRRRKTKQNKVSQVHGPEELLAPFMRMTVQLFMPKHVMLSPEVKTGISVLMEGRDIVGCRIAHFAQRRPKLETAASS